MVLLYFDEGGLPYAGGGSGGGRAAGAAAAEPAVTELPADATALEGLFKVILADMDRRLDALDADANELLSHYKTLA